MLILLELPHPPAVYAKEPCGPPAPVMKGVSPHSAAFSLARASKALREMPGAVVVVEEDAPEPLAKAATAQSFIRRRLHLRLKKEFPAFPVTPPMPQWMDPNVTVSGGNVVHQNFPLGWGY